MEDALYLVQKYYVPSQFHPLDHIRCQVLLNLLKLLLVRLYLVLVVQLLDHLGLQHLHRHLFVLFHVQILGH